MGNANLNAQVIGEQLSVLLEDIIARTVTATTITQKQDRGGIRIVVPAMVHPPVVDGITGKFSGISTGPNLNIALVLAQIVETMRNGYPLRQRLPIMVIDVYHFGVVGVACSIERTNQFFFFVSTLITGLPSAS